MLIKFTNCKLTIDGNLKDQDLWIDTVKGQIVDPQKVFYDERRPADRIINLDGKIIAPGFIDVQINGAMGMDFSVFQDDEMYARGVKSVNQALVKYGVTAYCPTLTSQKSDIYKKTLPHLRQRTTRNPKDGAEILGAHVEGPFLQPSKPGIHSTAVFRIAHNGFSDLESCYGKEHLTSTSPSIPPTIKIITAAPEVPGMLDLINECAKRNIIFSIGHSSAGVETAEYAIEHGATFITHLFNAMQGLHHRDPGIVGLLGSDDTLRPFYGIIVDGIHIHRSCVKLAYRSHPNGAVLVTDAMSQLGLPDGTYDWTNGTRITKEGMRLHLENEETIAGSAVTLDQCVRNLVAWTSCSLAQAVESVTSHPSTLLKLQHKKGFLKPGMDADLVILDAEGNVHQTWKFGEKVFDVINPVVTSEMSDGVRAERKEVNAVKRLIAPRMESIGSQERYYRGDGLADGQTNASSGLSGIGRVNGVKVH